MRSNALIDCCGIAVLSQFGNTNTALISTPYTAEEVEKFLTDQETAQRNWGKSLLLATINGEQKEKLGHIFKKLKWRIVSKSYHPNHQTHIYTLIKKLQCDTSGSAGGRMLR